MKGLSVFSFLLFLIAIAACTSSVVLHLHAKRIEALENKFDAIDRWIMERKR
jgi:hypothetical protein